MKALNKAGRVVAEAASVVDLQRVVSNAIHGGSLPDENYDLIREDGHREPLITWDDTDDNLPVTAEWLEEFGFVHPNENALWCWVLSRDRRIVVKANQWCLYLEDGEDSVLVQVEPTRGDVLHLSGIRPLRAITSRATR